MYDDTESWILGAIKNKYASKVYDQLKSQLRPIEYPSDPSVIGIGNRVEMYVTAFGKTYYDDELKQVVVECVAGAGKRGDFRIRTIISKEKIMSINDSMACADHILKEMRQDVVNAMIEAMVDEEGENERS